MIISAYDRIEDVRSLFSEYTDMLVSINPEFHLYLDIQHYDDEKENPSLKYALPDGRLYLDISDDGIARGCIALRKLSDGKGEVKRLYVRPEYRGNGIATALVERIVEDARNIGYKELYLDTLPELESAVRLYKSFGFEETGQYNDSPVDKTIFMKLSLT